MNLWAVTQDWRGKSYFILNGIEVLRREFPISEE